jgi:hypothetical protein
MCSQRLARLFFCLIMLVGFVPGMTILSARDVFGQEPPLAPTPLPGLRYDAEFFPGADHDPGLPTVHDLLGFDLGERFTSPEEITQCVLAWDEASPRVKTVEYARTHEGRPLHYVVITSAGNQARLEEIQAAIQRLADPRGLSESEADRLSSSLPAVGWFAYSIHGNETSGADAALAVIHHLAADRTSATDSLLQELVVIVDPLMNPDGRARFFQQVAQHRGGEPNVDDQSLLHGGDWPSGRTNHYYCDLNRDFLVAAHPETRGRMRALGEWLPLIFVDGHEMGSQDTYLFSPPRDPINPHLPPKRMHWGEVFAVDQARAFDAHGWRYYTGEWNDEWYVGYSSWASYRGGLFILYEQARVAEDAVRQAGGKLLSYGESVHHQIVSTMANLRTLYDHRQELKSEFAAQRRRAVSEDSPLAGTTYAIVPDGNHSRLRRFLELMALHGVEVHQAVAPITVRDVRDGLGRVHERLELPRGTLLISGRQPEAYLVAGLFDLDPHLTDETLQRERQELLRHGESRMYDTTAWSLPLMFGLEVYELPVGLPGQSRLLGPGEIPAEFAAAQGGQAAAGKNPAGKTAADETPATPAIAQPVAWVVDGADDRSVAFAARLLERGVRVRLADKPFAGDGRPFVRGSVVVTWDDNRDLGPGLAAVIDTVASTWQVAAVDLAGGLGAGELPDLGGRHFKLLEAPSIALVAGSATSAGDFGTIWYAIDQQLGLRHSHLDENRLTSADLRRYNVIVLPQRYGRELPGRALARLTDWVQAGGTLIAVGRAASLLLEGESAPSKVRDLPDVLADLAPYELAVWRQYLGETGELAKNLDVWSHTVPAEVPVPPPLTRSANGGERSNQPESTQAKSGSSAQAENGGGGGPSAADARRRRDDWLSLFMPQGAFLAARVDTFHWLTAGCGPMLPVLTGQAVGRGPVLMADESAEPPIRFGIFRPTADGKPGPERIGWSPVPPGQEMWLRMSGLLWPEAAQRLASSAYVTRERHGAGQIILFASSPSFRSATLGTQRLLLNALVYGPGMGTTQPIRP